MGSSWFDKIFGKLTEWFFNIIANMCGGIIKNLYTYGSSIYDNCVEKALDLLGKGSLQFFGSNISGALGTIENAFVGLGLLLCSVAFLASFIQESLEGIKDKRTEVWVKHIIMYIIATSLTAATPTIMHTLDTWGGAFASLAASLGSGTYTIKGNSTYEAQVDEIVIYDSAANPGGFAEKDGSDYKAAKEGGAIKDGIIGVGIGSMFVALLYFLATMVSGFIILYQAFARFFKMLIAIPYAGIGFGCLCGGHEVRRTFDSYLRFVLNIQLSAGTMCMLLILIGTLMADHSDIVDGLFSQSGPWQIMLGKIFVCLCGVGLIRSAEQLTERMLGLH